MPESPAQQLPCMEPGTSSTSDLTIPRADSPPLEGVSTTTSTTFLPSTTPAPTISQPPPSIPPTQNKSLAPADNKPLSSSSQPTSSSPASTSAPSVPSVVSTTAPALSAGIGIVGPALKNTTLQDPTKLSETTLPTHPNSAASITPTEIPVSIQQSNNTHSSIKDSSNSIHDRANRPLPPIPALDYIVPYESRSLPQLPVPPAHSSNTHVKSVEERILPTIIAAELERKKYAERAMMKGYTMNIAIGIQLLVGALTTAISALVTGREISIVLPILGGISTLTAAFLTRARGSNEPERSLMVAKDLEQFIRECKAFLVDFGSSTDDVDKREVQRLRSRFEEILRDAEVEKK